MSTTQGGRFANGVHQLPVRIYYEDTDFSGVVYHASYLRFMERGRTEYLRLSGVDHKALLQGDMPLAFAVRRMQIDFARPARIDDLLSVQTRFVSARGARIEAHQSILHGEELLVSAEVQIACIDLEGRPRRLPKPLLLLLEPFLVGQ
ncbi:MAG: tol-pal system-associated acyl-CoA thioesterase [Robiginitomaculum sp.]|nr:tol-pal system-associated acyl-CoA thioesterase [Robiginitomaculum sp.]MDQ7078686.1 tol-pal system-associated acyl-CoA thioesterase [Robiginitomaculum sp.]